MMTALLDEALAVAVAEAVLSGDRAAVVRLLAMADEPDQDAEWFHDVPEVDMSDDDLPWGDILADENDLPWAAEIPDAGLPLADEMTETESYIYNGGTIFATSSVINEWKYYGDTKELYIQFKGSKKTKWKGRIYRLDNVSFKTVMEFYRSDSPGRYFNWHLKGRYTGDKLGVMPAAKGRNVVKTLD
jgi:hypothetical protein